MAVAGSPGSASPVAVRAAQAADAAAWPQASPAATASAASREVLLSAEQLALGYGARSIVQGANLQVRRGDFWFLLGPNGAGKSTFARTVLGLRKPSSGHLAFHGEAARRDALGFVPQQCVLHPTLSTTVEEFVGLGFGTLRLPRAERRERVQWAIAAVGLAGSERSDVHDLSGGMRQRAIVARALVRRPVLLVLDEPTASLDPASQEALLLMLARLHRESGLTLLFVCHDVAVAARYATHVGLFHDGMVEAGPRELLLDAAALTRTYGVPLEVSLDDEGHATVRLGTPGQDAAEPHS